MRDDHADFYLGSSRRGGAVGAWLTFLFLCMSLFMTGCKQDSEGGYFMDTNGFVLGGGDDPKSAPPLHVGIGDSPERLLERNPYLKGLVWIPEPGDPYGGEMRLSLQAYSQLHYDDGDLKFEVCAHSLSVDGNKHYPRGVSTVGVALCDWSLNDHRQAIRLADEFMKELKQRNPSLQDLRDLYQHGNLEARLSIGGRSWTDDPIRRSRIYTLDEAEKIFSGHLTRPELETDTWGQDRPRHDNLKVGIFAGKRAVVQVTVNSATKYGDKDLDREKRLAMRYSVFVEIRLRNDMDPKTFTSEKLAK